MKEVTLKFRTTNRDIFEAIKKGKKKVETRAATIRYQNIQKGDVVKFVCEKDSFKKKVTKVATYKTITALLKKYKPQEITPRINSEKELRALYYSFPGYKEKIKKNGLMALELK